MGVCLLATTAMVAVMLSGPVPAFAAERTPAATAPNKHRPRTLSTMLGADIAPRRSGQAGAPTCGADCNSC
jgi:hypothetical protein